MPLISNVVGGGIGNNVSVQRGVTSSATTVTINEVDMDKTIVLSVSKGSSGYVAARGNISSANLNIASKNYKAMRSTLYSSDDYGETTSTFPALSGTISSTTLSGGSTDLTVKEYSARLISPTQIQTDGACEWQVIEFK